MSNLDAHFDGDTLRIDATAPAPFRLEVIIDSYDAAENPETPFTLNALVGFEPAALEHLLLDGESALIEGTVPDQLRVLADLIEQGKVGR